MRSWWLCVLYLPTVLPSGHSVCVSPEGGFHIDLDDFLMGIISVANELVSSSSRNWDTWREGYLLPTWAITCWCFDWMLQGIIRAFNWNVGKLFSELKLVPDNLLFIYAGANWEATESCRYSQELVFWNLVRCFYGIRHSSIFRLGLLDCSLMSRLHRLTGRINSLVTQFKFPTLASAFKTNGHFATPGKARFYYYIRKLVILQSDWSPTTFWQ